MTDKTYTITVTEKQAMVIKKAMEIYARLGMGQFRDALDELPLQPIGPMLDGWFKAKERIGDIIKQYTIDKVDGWQSSLGITSDKVDEDAKIAWDICQVLRQMLHRANDLMQSSNEPFAIMKEKE